MFPQLPTDSLYKFLALAGIALIVTSAYLQHIINTSYQISGNDILFNLKQNDQIMNYLIRIETTYRNDPVRRQNMYEKIDSMQQYRAAEFHVIQNGMAEWSDLNRNRYAEWMWYAGWLIAPIGFILWYRQVQRYLDLMLREQAAGRLEQD